MEKQEIEARPAVKTATLEELAESFKNEQLILTDLHTHFYPTNSAQIQKDDFNKVVDQINRKLGEYTLIGLINVHNNVYEQFIGLKGYERIDIGNAICIPDKKIVIVKGQKVFTNQGSFISLGINNSMCIKSGDISLEEALKESRNLNTVNLMALPFFEEGCGAYVGANPKLLEYFAAIEIINKDDNTARQLRDFVLFKEKILQTKLVDYFRQGIISASNGHSFEEIGKNFTPLSHIDISNPDNLNNSLSQALIRESLLNQTLGDYIKRS